MISDRSVAPEQQELLSDQARLELILRFSDWNELVETIKQDPMQAYQVYIDRTSKDCMISSKRKKLLAFIFERINND
jgi:transposase